MPIYVDLFPTPQFDRSLVTYCVINFERIRDGLSHAGRQVRFENQRKSGPFGETSQFIINVPYACDVVIWNEITSWASVVMMGGWQFLWDQAVAAPHIIADQFFNEANSHKKLSSMHTIRNVRTTGHTWRAVSAHQTMTSDVNDRWNAQFTYYEIK